MRKVQCNIITNETIAIAKVLGLSPSVTNNLINCWQTESGKVIMPTIQMLEEYKRAKNDELNDIALAIPNYSAVKGDSSKETKTSIIKNQNGTYSIVLHTFGEGFDVNSIIIWTHSDSLTKKNKDLFIRDNYSPKSIYFFELYAAKSAIENGRTEITEEDRKNAIELLRRLNQTYPDMLSGKSSDARVDTLKKPEEKTVYDELEKYREEFESDNPIRVPKNQERDNSEKDTDDLISKVRDYFLGGYALSEEDAKAYIELMEQRTKEDRENKENINIAPSKEGFDKFSKGYTWSTREELGGALAKTNSNGSISIARDITVADFFNYILGKDNTETSRQKEAVFNELIKAGYSFEALKSIIQTPEDVAKFLQYHELSHIYNDDMNNYFEPEEIGKPKNWMTPKKIGIEARATADAWNRLYNDKKRAFEEQQHQAERSAIMEGAENRRAKRSIGGEILSGEVTAARIPATPTSDSNTKEELPEYVLDPNDIPNIGDVVEVDESDPRVRLVTDFTIGEIQLRVDNIAREVSEAISTLLDKQLKSLYKELETVSSADELYTIKERIDLFKDPAKGRREVLRLVGIEPIYKAMKETFQEYANMSDEEAIENFGEEGPVIKEKYQKIADNFDLLFEDACTLVEQFENCRIILNKHDYNNGNTVEKVIGGEVKESVKDEQKKENQFGDDTEGKRATGNDGWGFQVRFVDPRDTLSAKVRAIISDIIQVDSNGNTVFDDLHNPVYIRQDRVYSTLMAKLSTIIVDADDFVTIDENRNITGFPALEELAIEYPWVHQIINKLKADPMAVSLFYSNFRQDFINYWMQSDGKTFPLNKNTIVEDTVDTVIANYEKGEVLDNDSIYKQDKSFNKSHISKGVEILNSLDNLNIENKRGEEEFVDSLTKVLKMVGVPSKKGSIIKVLNSKEGDGYAKLMDVANRLRTILSVVDTLPNGSHLMNNKKTIEAYRAIAEVVGDVNDVTGSQSFRQDSKTRYSYSAPNFISNMVKSFKRNSKRDNFIQEKYKAYRWFFNPDTETWNNHWLELIESDEDVRDMLEIKEVISIRDTTESHNSLEYNQWTPGIIKKAFINEYFSLGESEGSEKQFAWYNFPIFADSETAMFIKFVRYTDNFEEHLLPLMSKVVYQELERIELVRRRQQLIKEGKIKEIDNFDANGGEFKFFPQLNGLKLKDGRTFLQTITDLNDGSAEGNEAIDNLIKDTLTTIMNLEFVKFLKTAEPVIQDLIDKDIASTRDGAIEKLREYFWNSTYATSQIIQLTAVDLAFYKNADDFQKRYKEVYAAGIKLNTNSKYGKKKQNAIYLIDDLVTSATYSPVKRGLDKAVAEKRITAMDRDAILHKFRNITATDAQAFRTLPSFRSVLDMLGLWTPKMETALNHFENNEWDMADFNVIWQTIKPFVYSILDKPTGVGSRMPVPHQNKNSEFLLLTAYQLVSGVTGQSPLLRGLNRAMLDNNIDIAEYGSAVKVGGQGAIDVTYSRKTLDKVIKEGKVSINGRSYKIPTSVTEFRTEDEDNPGIKEYFDSLLHNGTISQDEYNNIIEEFRPDEDEVYNIITDSIRTGENLIDDGNGGKFNEEVVHQASFEDYIIQQPTPEHLFDVEAIFGSQFRNLIVSDMDDDIEITIETDKGPITLKGKEEVLGMYQRLIIENLLEKYQEVTDRFTDIHTLQQALMDVVRGNPKYGKDMIEALKIVKHVVNGVEVETFNIPPHCPTITDKVQEIINSLFKNAVTKQYIKGGNCILVSDVGLTDKLHIEYDSNGKLIGAQCYMPFYTKKYFLPFLTDVIGDNGEVIGQQLDIEAIRENDPELLRMVGYRIPTENKYSMLPLIIKGFLPQQNGSSIMLPADVTQLAGSDFDVDKLFIMLPEFKVYNYDMYRAIKDFKAEQEENNKEITEPIKTLLEALDGKSISEEDYNSVELSKDSEWNKWWKENKRKYKFKKPKIKSIKYDDSKPISQNSRAQRNNRIIQIAFGILTHPSTREKFNNPGNFDEATFMAGRSFIIRDIEIFHSYMEKRGFTSVIEASKALFNEDPKYIKDFVKKYKASRNPLSLDTFIYYHTQNMAGAALIGVYANNTTMQAKFQNSKLALKPEFSFTINGRSINSLHDVYIQFKDGSRELISGNCSQFSAASVDNAKNPVLADLLQNPNTARVTGFMLRASMTIEEIMLFFSQPIVAKCIQNTGNLKGLAVYIKDLRETLSKLGIKVKNSTSIKKNYTSEFLLRNIILYNEAESLHASKRKSMFDSLTDTVKSVDGVSITEILENNLRAAILFQSIIGMSEKLNEITGVCRADSPKGAMGRSLALVKRQTKNVEKVRNEALYNPKYPFTGVAEVLTPNLVSPEMSIDEIRSRLEGCPLSMLQAFYSLGIELPSKLLGKWFVQSSPYIEGLVDHLYDEVPDISQKGLERFYRGLIIYGLSTTKMFGDDGTETFDKKRNYYLYDFPKKFMNEIIKDEYKDIRSLDALRKLSISEYGVLEMYKSARTTSIMRSFLSADFDKLISINTESARNLARDLFMYAYYDNGLGFGANNYGTLFSTFYLTKFPEFVNTLRDMNFREPESIFTGYFDQFCLNNPNLFPEVQEVENVDEDSVLVENDKVRNARGVPREYIRIMNEETQKFDLYVRDSSTDLESKTLYRKVNYYIDPSGNNRSKYNANVSAFELTDNVDKARVESSKNTSIRYIAAVEQEEEERQFEDMIDGLDDSDFDDIDNYDIDEG